MKNKKQQSIFDDPTVQVEMMDDEMAAAKKVADQGFELITQLEPEHSYYRETVARMLGRIDPRQSFGTALYNAVARLSWNMFFEAVAMRRRGKKLQVYLRKRADDDTAYPGEWHAPGSVFRPGETERDVADRLKQEFGVPISSFRKVGEHVDWDKSEDRGSGVSRVYLVELNGAPRQDDRHGWFPVDELPEITVDSHRDGIIPLAVKAFKAKAAKQAANQK